MTNPDNAVGTNGAFGGRTSVNAFNDVLAVFTSRGVLTGWTIEPSSGMTVAVGGDGETRDVAIAEDNAGNKTTINNISEEPIEVTIDSAPASNSRIDAIVAYVDNPPQGSSTITDNYEACGLIVVSGTTAASPTAPDESDIRTAITTDGGSGATAYYVVLGTVTVASGTTDITSDMITAGNNAGIGSYNIDSTTFTITGGEVSFGVLECVENSNIVTINIQTASHIIAERELYGIVPEKYRPAGSKVFAGVVQGTGASCSIILEASTGRLYLDRCANLPSTSNRVGFSVSYAI